MDEQLLSKYSGRRFRAFRPGYIALATELNLKKSALLFDQSVALLDHEWLSNDNDEVAGAGVAGAFFIEWYDSRDERGHSPKSSAVAHLKTFFALNDQVTFVPVVSGETKVESLLPKAIKTDAVSALLENMPMIDEVRTPWGVVSQIRADGESLHRCRLLRRWILTSLAEADYARASDEIAIRIYEYERALKKHGSVTVEGVFETIFNGQSVAGAISAVLAGSAAGTLSGSPVVGATAGALALIGNVAIRLRKARRELETVASTPGGEIAYLFDLKDRCLKSGC